MALTKVSAGVLNVDDLYGFRNRIINGDMRIDQRNAGAAVTVDSSTNFFTVDRFLGTGQTTDGVFTVQQSTTAPAGFTNSLVATITTADTSLGSTQRYAVGQLVEGFNVADLGWGASGAQTITLSFWVRSSLTGTFGGSVVNSGFDRSYPFTYTITAANTFEYKTVTIDGDTSGTWLKNNGVGLRLYFSLGAGTDRSGTAGAWNGNNNFSATGATSVVGTSGATLYITGVQLEKGTVATPFERRPFGTELALCQRYYERWVRDDGGRLIFGYKFTEDEDNLMISASYREIKRTTPTITYASITSSGTGSISSTSVTTLTPSNFIINVDVGGTNRFCSLNGFLAIDAEL
jgi:hypothetical protein